MAWRLGEQNMACALRHEGVASGDSTFSQIVLTLTLHVHLFEKTV